jgi:hypothetical protein
MATQKEPADEQDDTWQLSLKGRFASQLRGAFELNAADAEMIAQDMMDELVDYIRSGCEEESGFTPALILNDDDTLTVDLIVQIPEEASPAQSEAA